MSFGNEWFPLGICAYGAVLFSNASFSKCANLLSVNTGFVLSSGVVVLWCGEEEEGGLEGGDSPDVSSSTQLDTDRLAPLGGVVLIVCVMGGDMGRG